MSWQAELDELKRREAFAEELGGLARIQRQRDGGRYTIRERVTMLADDGSFHEIGKIANWISPPSRGVNDNPFEFEYVKLT